MDTKEKILIVVLFALIGIGVFLYFRKNKTVTTTPTGVSTTKGATPTGLTTETTPEGIVNVIVGSNPETGVKTVKSGLLS